MQRKPKKQPQENVEIVLGNNRTQTGESEPAAAAQARPLAEAQAGTEPVAQGQAGA